VACTIVYAVLNHAAHSGPWNLIASSCSGGQVYGGFALRMQNEVAANLQCLWQCVAVSQQCDHVVYLGVFAHELLGQDVSGLESDVRPQLKVASVTDAIATPPTMGNRDSTIGMVGVSPRNAADRATLKNGSSAYKT